MAYRAPNAVPVIVLMAAALAVSVFFAYRPETGAVAADVTRIPTQAGEWKLSKTIDVDAATMAQIKATSFVARRYVNPAGQMVDLLVVYRSYGRREFAHRPELCFPAAGYTITHKGREKLPYAGREIDAISLRARGLQGDNRTLAYFFASGKRTEADFLRQQVLMALERLIPNKNGWTFIRLDSPTRTTDADAAAAQEDFMRAFAPAIESAITTDKT